MHMILRLKASAEHTHKWPARLQEFAAWIDLQGTKPHAHTQVVLREFMAR